MAKSVKAFHSRLRQSVEKDRANKISIKEIASTIGLTPTMLSAYAYGDAVPNAYNLARIADHYNVSLEYLMGRTRRSDGCFVTANYDVFHNRLRAFVDKQRRKGASVRVISEEMGITQNSLKAYAYGVSFPNALSLAVIADYYDVTMDYLMGRTAVTGKERETG